MVSQLSFQRDWANQTSFGTAKIMAKIREFVLPGKEKNRDWEATINHWLTHVSTLSILTSASPGLQPLFPVKSPMSYRMETSQSCVVYKELFFLTFDRSFLLLLFLEVSFTECNSQIAKLALLGVQTHEFGCITHLFILKEMSMLAWTMYLLTQLKYIGRERWFRG